MLFELRSGRGFSKTVEMSQKSDYDYMRMFCCIPKIQCNSLCVLAQSGILYFTTLIA